MPRLNEAMGIHILDVINPNWYMQKHNHHKARIVVGVQFAINDDSVYEKLADHAKHDLCQSKPNDPWKYDWKNVERIRQKRIHAHARQPVQGITIGSFGLVIPSDVEDCREPSRKRVLFELVHQQRHKAEQKNLPQRIDLVPPKANKEGQCDK